MDGDRSLRLTDAEIARAFSDPAVAAKFPPIMSLEEAASLFQIPLGTLRDWRSRQLLNGCTRKVGKHVRVWRDRFIQAIFNEGVINSDE